MASDNETVAEVAKQMRRNELVFHHLYWCEYADRIEAAHRREVAELRECLKEAVEYRCCNCAYIDEEESAAYGELVCADNDCPCLKWRDALAKASGESEVRHA